MRAITISIFLMLGCDLSDEIADAADDISSRPGGSCERTLACMEDACSWQGNASPERASGYMRGCAAACSFEQDGEHVQGLAAAAWEACERGDESCGDRVAQCVDTD